jgi:hypothetical protein
VCEEERIQRAREQTHGEAETVRKQVRAQAIENKTAKESASACSVHMPTITSLLDMFRPPWSSLSALSAHEQVALHFAR